VAFYNSKHGLLLHERWPFGKQAAPTRLSTGKTPLVIARQSKKLIKTKKKMFFYAYGDNI
jgi:hypothetical protein